MRYDHALSLNVCHVVASSSSNAIDALSVCYQSVVIRLRSSAWQCRCMYCAAVTTWQIQARLLALYGMKLDCTLGAHAVSALWRAQICTYTNIGAHNISNIYTLSHVCASPTHRQHHHHALGVVPTPSFAVSLPRAKANLPTTNAAITRLTCP